MEQSTWFKTVLCGGCDVYLWHYALLEVHAKKKEIVLVAIQTRFAWNFLSAYRYPIASVRDNRAVQFRNKICLKVGIPHQLFVHY